MKKLIVLMVILTVGNAWGGGILRGSSVYRSLEHNWCPEKQWEGWDPSGQCWECYGDMALLVKCKERPKEHLMDLMLDRIDKLEKHLKELEERLEKFPLHRHDLPYYERFYSPKDILLYGTGVTEIPHGRNYHDWMVD